MGTNLIIDPGAFKDLKYLMGDDFIAEIIDTYKVETGELIQQLRQALAADDTVSFARLAHSIKSSSASLGAMTFSEQARELEMLGKGNDLSGAASKLERLAADFLEVKRRLEEMNDEP